MFVPLDAAVTDVALSVKGVCSFNNPRMYEYCIVRLRFNSPIRDPAIKQRYMTKTRCNDILTQMGGVYTF